VRYIDHGTSPDGRHYLVLEWLDGEDLATRLESEALTPQDSLRVAHLAADALAAAHARGIVHRDVKPSNLFLVGGNVEPRRVLDSGVALTGRAAARMTVTGTMIGTPGYMAPEQVCGARDVGPTADVFSLGCVLFECLTGTPAIRTDRPAGAMLEALSTPIPS